MVQNNKVTNDVSWETMSSDEMVLECIKTILSILDCLVYEIPNKSVGYQSEIDAQIADEIKLEDIQ